MINNAPITMLMNIFALWSLDALRVVMSATLRVCRCEPVSQS
jgi:hypothetical protein